MNQEHCCLSFLGPCLPGAGPAAGRWWPQAGKGDREGTAMFSWFSDTPDFHSPLAAVPEILN